MSTRLAQYAKFSHEVRFHGQRGVALILALLLLLVLSALGLAMMLAVNSDMLVNRYYRNSRGAFYAADAGLAIARTDMGSQLQAAIPNMFPANQQPIPAGTESTVLSYINNTYNGNSFRTDVDRNGSWPAGYKVKLNWLTQKSCVPSGGTGGGACTAPTGTPTTYTYTYSYNMQAFGQVQGGTRQTTLEETGTIIVVANVQAASASTVSFAGWGMFIDDASVCDGTYLVPGTISGPVFTNGGFTFSDTGKYIFTDNFATNSGKVGYEFTNSGNHCDQVAGQSDTYNHATISPTFQGTFKLGQSKLTLPGNDFNQQRAVLDGIGQAGQPSNSDRNAALRNAAETKYPSGGASTGVFLPYTVDSNGAARFTGGGILVEGDASSITLSTSGNAQVYKIVQGSGSSKVTTTITIDNTANTTTFSSSSGSNTVTIQGVPQQFDSTGHAMGDATMLYVDGSINALSGPGVGQAAIQDGTALTITAAKNVSITGDILYKTEPVTLTQNQIPNTPADTLIPGNNKGQALGIFTAAGDIILNNSQNSQNLEIDASLASISSGGSGGLVNNGSNINTLTIVGGRIQNTIKNIGATTRNVFFDRRYSQNNFAPPWFPSTSISNAGLDQATPKVSYQRIQWVNQTPSF